MEGTKNFFDESFDFEMTSRRARSRCLSVLTYVMALRSDVQRTRRSKAMLSSKKLALSNAKNVKSDVFKFFEVKDIATVEDEGWFHHRVVNFLEIKRFEEIPLC